ncbi:N-acetyl-gamma-glutamyl-phosphate reductase [Nocardia sp. NPDC127526]|uniref:N-acetyl-gamma-glutamyl-phosphate reductase n=1 Tax=Nocardia sp. NPDC127526 TaxID=3345393 RepID=UPI003643A32C
MAESRKDRIRVAVIGASGHAGGELVRLLLDHPGVDLAFLSAERNAGSMVGVVHPWLRNHTGVAGSKFRPLAELSTVDPVDVAFTCLPSGTLPSVLGQIRARAQRVFNVAGDYRLHDAAELREHYPASADNPARFDYYIPELAASAPDTQLVNLPGCMAVTTVYALYPLFAGPLVQPQVIVDAKTGSTGGGRRNADSHAGRAGNFRVHKLFGHRHAPEIRQAVHDATGTAPQLRFSTYSLDVSRGIMVTAYATLLPDISPLEVKRAFARAYAGKPFVRVRTAPRRPQDYPMLKAVVGSNVAEVAVSVRGRHVVAVAALDNLIKGAAGQAIQALNLTHGFDETLGLPLTAVAP